MATHAGKEGTVKIGSDVIAETISWQIQETGETVDTTTLDNSKGYRTHLHTLKSWEGSIECLWDETDSSGQGAVTIGASVTLSVYPEGDSSGDIYYSGTATVTQIQRQASVDGRVEASFSFQGTGALTQSTVA